MRQSVELKFFALIIETIPLTNIAFGFELRLSVWTIQ